MNRSLLPSLLAAVFLLLAGPDAAGQQRYAFTNFAGLPGTSGAADGTGADARFDSPAGVAVDADGNLLVADLGNHTIRKITPAGVVSTFAGVARQSGHVDGPAASARFNQPFFLALDPAGNLYVSDLLNHVIRKITRAGMVSTFAGGNGEFNRPAELAFDANGTLFVTDTAHHVIRLVTSRGLVLTLAGMVDDSGSNDGPASTARFNFPSGLVVDSQGNIYVSDSGNDTIRKIAFTGTVTTLAGARLQKAGTDGAGGAARFYQPYGLRLDAAGNLIVADPGNHAIRRVTPAGEVTTLGGLSGQAGTTDGLGTAARFSNPSSIALDATGAFFVSDPLNHRISRATRLSVSPRSPTPPKAKPPGRPESP